MRIWGKVIDSKGGGVQVQAVWGARNRPAEYDFMMIW